jgi:glycosyltransferase involved in cell wall biosynthesis/peptidoglycan/xylan/chitin deacetylase (PgdA/CDA1 family)
LSATSKDTSTNNIRVTLVCQGFERRTLKLQPWRRVYEISRRIASQGTSVTILTDGESAQSEKIENLTIIRVGELTFAPLFRKEKLKKILFSTNPDVVVWYGSPFSALYLAGFKSLGKPLIWDIDTDIYNLKFLSRLPIRVILNPINGLYTYFAAAMLSRFTLRNVGNSRFINRIVVPNVNLKKEFCKQGIASAKIIVVPSTIEKEETSLTGVDSKRELCINLGFKVDDLLITYFGSPHRLRGPDVAILSMPKILTQIENARLLILSRRVIGGIDDEDERNRIEEDYLKKLVSKLVLKNYVDIIPGFMEKEALKQYLEISNLIIFPFRLVSSEPPLSVFEAMFLGKAVITTEIGCLREIVESNRGLSVEPGNASQLADAIVFLAKNPEKLAEISQNAKKFAYSLPEWDLVSQNFSKLLATVCQENRARFGSGVAINRTDLTSKKMSLKDAFTNFAFTEKRGAAIESSISLFSQIYHLISFELGKPRNQFEKAMLIFSVDVDAGCRQLGFINQGRNDRNVHLVFSESFIGGLEEFAIPVLGQAFSNFEVPATFAIRGQLADVSPVTIELLLDSPVKHDIGAHGYSHRNFQTLSIGEAEDELKRISASLGKYGIIPKSFVFPRNGISHLDLLRNHGYKCYREGARNILEDGMFIDKKEGLFNIQPSLYLNTTLSPTILERILDIAIAKRAPLHLWFHPWTFGNSKSEIKKYVQNVFSPFLKYAQAKQKKGQLSFETMLSAAEQAEKLFGDTI